MPVTGYITWICLLYVPLFLYSQYNIQAKRGVEKGQGGDCMFRDRWISIGEKKILQKVVSASPHRANQAHGNDKQRSECMPAERAHPSLPRHQPPQAGTEPASCIHAHLGTVRVCSRGRGLARNCSWAGQAFADRLAGIWEQEYENALVRNVERVLAAESHLREGKEAFLGGEMSCWIKFLNGNYLRHLVDRSSSCSSEWLTLHKLHFILQCCRHQPNIEIHEFSYLIPGHCSGQLPHPVSPLLLKHKVFVLQSKVNLLRFFLI